MTSRVRDSALLDALEKLKQAPFSATVWRSVRQGQDPTTCWSAGGRWDDRSFDVLYTSTTRDGAIAERRFHLFRGQPIPPSKMRYELFELHARLSAVIQLSDLTALRGLGMDTSGYGRASYANKESEYPSSQAIAEACYFLGADGILVPSARHASPNLIVFCDQDSEKDIELMESHGVIDWTKEADL